MLNQPFPKKRPDSSHTYSSSISPSSLTSARPLTLQPSTVEHIPLQTSSVTTVSVSAAETPIPSKTTPEWSVEYEKTESRAIDLTFVCAFAQEANTMSMVFSPDGKYLAASTASYTGKISIYEVDSAKEAWSVLMLDCISYYCLIISDISVFIEPSPSLNDRLGIWYLRFAPDGRHLAATGTDDRIRVCLPSFSPRKRFLNLHFQLWNISEKRVRSAYGMISNAAVFDISPGGRFLACASFEGIIIWRIRDGSKQILRDNSSYAVTFVRFSPNGLYIVTVDFQDMLTIWNIRTGHIVARWTKHEKNPQNVNGLRGRYHESQRFWTVSSVGENTTAEEDQEEEILLFTGHSVRLVLYQTPLFSYTFTALEC
jgi:WD40 repeat protein